MGSKGGPALAAVLLALAAAGALADAPAADVYLKQAESDPALRATLVAEGKSASFFCANCHGETGNSRFPEVPNLAAQNPAYVLVQIDAFLSGKRRDPFMEGLMKVLSERQKAAIAAYYASMVARPVAAPGPQAADGSSHFRRLCVACHGADAHGSATFPRLAAQQPEYLRTSLKRYLAQSGVRNSAEMTSAVTQLGEANIEPVVEYLSSLK